MTESTGADHDRPSPQEGPAAVPGPDRAASREPSHGSGSPQGTPPHGDLLPEGLVRPAPAGGWATGLEEQPATPIDPEVALRRDLEAILLVADEPISVAELARILEHPAQALEDLLVELAAAYAREQRGFTLRAVAGGWRLYTHPAAHPAVDAYLRAGTRERLTQAALETLAVIAYRQPCARAHIAAVRGVNVDGVLRTLTSRGLITVVGHDPGPGQAALYGTTRLFLEQLGINSLEELPPVGDYLPDGVDLSELESSW
jgi:segregation and condensation protein B